MTKRSFLLLAFTIGALVLAACADDSAPGSSNVDDVASSGDATDDDAGESGACEQVSNLPALAPDLERICADSALVGRPDIYEAAILATDCMDAESCEADIECLQGVSGVREGAICQLEPVEDPCDPYREIEDKLWTCEDTLIQNQRFIVASDGNTCYTYKENDDFRYNFEYDGTILWLGHIPYRCTSS